MGISEGALQVLGKCLMVAGARNCRYCRLNYREIQRSFENNQTDSLKMHATYFRDFHRQYLRGKNGGIIPQDKYNVHSPGDPHRRHRPDHHGLLCLTGIPETVRDQRWPGKTVAFTQRNHFTFQSYFDSARQHQGMLFTLEAISL